MVWSTRPIAEMDKLKGAAPVTDAFQIQQIQEFLHQHETSPPSMETDTTNKINILTANADILVHRINFEHLDTGK